MPEPDDLLKGGELVLTTGLGAGDEARHQAAWTASLVEQGMAALAVELGSSWRDVPAPVVAACARAGVPVVAFHRPVRFIEITEARARGGGQRAVRAARARGGDPPALHRADPAGPRRARDPRGAVRGRAATRCVLEDAGGSLVYYVSGPHGDDLALSAWADVHRAEDRGEVAEGMFAAEVRLLDSSWGRLLALALENPLDDFDRVAVERAALAVAIDLLAQQHDEQLRARSRGAFLSELADGRVEEADARRRAEALGFPGTGRGALLPVVAAWRAPAYARGAARAATRPATGERRRRHHLDAALGRPARRAGLDRPRRAARPARRRPARCCSRSARAGTTRRSPSTSRTSSTARWTGTGSGPADAALAIGGAADTWVAAGQGLRRVRRSAGAATSLPVARWHDARRPGVADLLHDLRDTPELETFVEEQLGPLLADGAPRTRVAAGDAGGVSGGGRAQGRGRAGAAPRAPVAVPAAAPDRGGARRLARRRGRRPRPAPGRPRPALPPRG